MRSGFGKFQISERQQQDGAVAFDHFEVIIQSHYPSIFCSYCICATTLGVVPAIIRSMVDVCSNPSCNRRFLYLHEGRLYILRSTIRSKDRQSASGSNSSETTQWFWLCDACSRHMTLICNLDHEVVVAPARSNQEMRGRTASDNLPSYSDFLLSFRDLNAA